MRRSMAVYLSSAFESFKNFFFKTSLQWHASRKCTLAVLLSVITVFVCVTVTRIRDLHVAFQILQYQ